MLCTLSLRGKGLMGKGKGQKLLGKKKIAERRIDDEKSQARASKIKEPKPPTVAMKLHTKKAGEVKAAPIQPTSVGRR